MEESFSGYDSFVDESDSPSAFETEEATAQETESQEQPLKEKRACKPRKPNKLTNDTFKITRIDGRGVPAYKEKDDKMRTTTTNADVQVVVGGDDMLSRRRCFV